MALVWRRNQTPQLETQAWKVLCVDGNDYLIKGLFDGLGYHVMLCDMTAVWEENLDSNKTTRRSKILNPNVEAPVSVILDTLSTNLEAQQNDAAYSVTTSPTTVTLTLNTTLASLPFQWEFVCAKAPLESLSSHLITPTLCIVSELCRRQQELVQLLARKDKEIQDYKDHGAQVSRKHLETTPFDEKAFQNKMVASSEFEQASQLPLQVLEKSTFQELYRDVTMVRNWATKKDDFPAMEGGGFESETTGTWAGKLPASLLPAAPPTAPVHHTPPSKSPIKRPAEESPSKDDEHTRREALEKKLVEEKTRVKKKRKKLM